MVSVKKVITSEEVTALEKLATDMTRQLDELKQAFAEQECPFEVGDVVPIAGHAHRGKQGRVNVIRAARRWDTNSTFSHCWSVGVTVLKGDGTPGKLTASFRQDDWERYQKKLAESDSASQP